MFDPLVDWIVPEVQDRKKQKGLPKDPTGEVVNEKGLETLKAIEARLGKWIQVQSPLGFATLDKAAALGLATSRAVTDLRQYINSNLGFRDLKICFL